MNDKERIAALEVTLGLVKKELADGWLGYVCGEHLVSKHTWPNMRKILSTVASPLAVVDGYRLEALDWPFIVQEVAGDALLGVWETEPSEGWSNTPVTVIVLKKEASHEAK